MLKKLAFVFLLVTFVSSCGKPEANTTNTGNSNVRVADGKLDKGDRVVVPSGASKSMFLEADILTIEGQRVGVSIVRKNSPTAQIESAQLPDVYEVPGKGQTTDVKAGDIVLAKGETSELSPWFGAEVVSVSDAGVMIKGLGDDKPPRRFPADLLIKPSDKTITELKQSGSSTMLLTKATKHRPILVEGYKPKMGDRVLGEPALAGYWYSGGISKLEETRGSGYLVWVKWDDPNNKSTERVYTTIPLANAAKMPTPTVGRYVLVKPMSPGRWPYAEVTSVNGSVVEVRLEDGTTRTVNPGDFWPLEENPR